MLLTLVDNIDFDALKAEDERSFVLIFLGTKRLPLKLQEAGTVLMSISDIS